MMIQTETALSQPILNSLPRPQLSESGRNPSPVQEAERPDLYNLRLINEVEPPELQEVEVPKVLGDVFEALIGKRGGGGSKYYIFIANFNVT